jgi:hypothetical protein
MSSFIVGAASRHDVVAVEGREVEALAEHEDIGHDIAAAASDAVGQLWQPAHEFASGADTRLKLRGNTSGLAESDNGLPVPFVSGRPPPS